MAAPNKTLWPLEPHTRGKHFVLKFYLDAWLPIMGTQFGRILFIDGFAGPGKYEDGEPESPIIALNALENHASKSNITAEVIFYFIVSWQAKLIPISATRASTLILPV
jgi:three-Cys-motif partner protein